MKFYFSLACPRKEHARSTPERNKTLNVVHKLRTINNNYFRVAYVLHKQFHEFISLWRAPCVSTPERNKAPFVVHKLRTKKNN